MAIWTRAKKRRTNPEKMANKAMPTAARALPKFIGCFKGMNAFICRADRCFRQTKAPQKIPEGFLFLLSAMNAGA